ncbi:hypothetical protein LXL04_015438 [Taraxacum kok-saghyz]
MEPTNLVFFLIVCFLHDLSLAFSDHSNVPIGIHPLDEKYFASEVIRCKDGSNSFTKDRINDEFCDCVDGTDEPVHLIPSYCDLQEHQLALLPNSIAGFQEAHLDFYSLRELTTKFVVYLIPYCCDGSDEYDGSITCPNTCIMGGHSEYKTINYSSRISKFTSDRTKQNKVNLNGEDTIQKLQGNINTFHFILLVNHSLKLVNLSWPICFFI